MFYNIFFQHYSITERLNGVQEDKIRYFVGIKLFLEKTYET